MASSRFKSEQFTAEAFVESAGAVLFRLSSQDVCILHLLERNEYFLAKGRRNCGESRQAAALREIMETGFAGRLQPLNMSTRAAPAVDTEQLYDNARFSTGICEPFTLQIRRLSDGDVKLIWWFVAAVDKNRRTKGRYAVELHSYTDVMESIHIVKETGIGWKCDGKLSQTALGIFELECKNCRTGVRKWGRSIFGGVSFAHHRLTASWAGLRYPDGPPCTSWPSPRLEWAGR